MHQKLMIVGNVGRTPEMRYTPAGKAVTTEVIAEMVRFLGGRRTR